MQHQGDNPMNPWIPVLVVVIEVAGVIIKTLNDSKA